MRNRLSFPSELSKSYEWLFQSFSINGGSLNAYQGLPLPWWLLSFDNQKLPGTFTRFHASSLKKGSLESSSSCLNRMRLRILSTSGIKYFGVQKALEPTIGTLIYDSAGHNCNLPSDCNFHILRDNSLDDTPIP